MNTMKRRDWLKGMGLGIELNEEAIKEGMRKRRWDIERNFFRPTDEWNSERSNDRLWSRLTSQGLVA
jgi:hypothetical protein